MHHRRDRPVLHHVAAAGHLHADRLLQRRRRSRAATCSIQVGKEAVVNVDGRLDGRPASPRARSSSITGTAPIVDQGSTKTGMTITDDYTQQHPDAPYVRRRDRRSAGAAAQTRQRTASRSPARRRSRTRTSSKASTRRTPRYGGLSSNLPNEFIQETEVITGGYNAEYGRATGGIVNVVTKQGSNEFHGSVFGYYQPGALVAERRSRASARVARSIARPTSTTTTTSAPRSAVRSSRTSCGSTSASTRRSATTTHDALSSRRQVDENQRRHPRRRSDDRLHEARARVASRRTGCDSRRTSSPRRSTARSTRTTSSRSRRSATRSNATTGRPA